MNNRLENTFLIFLGTVRKLLPSESMYCNEMSLCGQLVYIWLLSAGQNNHHLPVEGALSNSLPLIQRKYYMQCTACFEESVLH